MIGDGVKKIPSDKIAEGIWRRGRPAGRSVRTGVPRFLGIECGSETASAAVQRQCEPAEDEDVVAEGRCHGEQQHGGGALRIGQVQGLTCRHLLAECGAVPRCQCAQPPRGEYAAGKVQVLFRA